MMMLQQPRGGDSVVSVCASQALGQLAKIKDIHKIHELLNTAHYVAWQLATLPRQEWRHYHASETQLGLQGPVGAPLAS
jgi:hypothetical protein